MTSPPAPPEPSRPLGANGQALWASIWGSADGRSLDAEMVLRVCERADEHASLRFKVIRDGDWRERSALRALDAQMQQDLTALGYTPTESVEAAVRREIEQMPNVAGTGIAATALALAKAMDRKTTALLANSLRDALAELRSLDQPAVVDAETSSDLDRIRARRAERRSS